MLPHLCAVNTAFAAICVVCNQVKQSAVFAICAFMQCAHWIACNVPCANNMESAMCAMQKHCGRSKLNQPHKKDCWWWCKIEIWRNGCDVMTTSIEPVQAGTHQSLGWQVVQSGAQMYCKQRWVVHCKQSSQGKLSRVGHRYAASREAKQRSTSSRALEASGAEWSADALQSNAYIHCKQSGDVLQAELWRRVVQGDSSFFHFSLDCSRRWQQHAVVCMQFALRYFLIFSSFGTYDTLYYDLCFGHLYDLLFILNISHFNFP